MKFSHNDQATAPLAISAFVVLSEAMRHAVPLGRGSRMHFSDRSYRTLAPRPDDNRVIEDLRLSHPNLRGVVAFLSDFSASAGKFSSVQRRRYRHLSFARPSTPLKTLPVRGWCDQPPRGDRVNNGSLATSTKLKGRTTARCCCLLHRAGETFRRGPNSQKQWYSSM